MDTDTPAPALGRRVVLKYGAAALAAGAMATPAAGSSIPGQAPSFRTPLCELLGITYPVLQAPMAGSVTPEMVAAVGEAGGLGILPGVGMPPEDLRRQIRRVRELSQRPFGVNLLLHPGIHHPADPADVPDETVGRIQAVLNRFRERLRIPASQGRPPRLPNLAGPAFEILLEESVPVFSIGLGTPPAEWVARCRERRVKVVAMASTVDDARALADLGVDALVAQGSEAGGHRSTWNRPEDPHHGMIGTLALVPQVVDAVRVPVIAAGGITDGRQVLAALTLGAMGVLIGTRFIATRESSAPAFHQRAIVRGDSDATVVTDAFSGLRARVIRNAYVDEYESAGAPIFPPFVQYVATADIRLASARQGMGDYYPLFAGQGIGLIRDTPGAGDVVRTVIAEAGAALEALPRRLASR